jgi:hypothetical protein
LAIDSAVTETSSSQKVEAEAREPEIVDSAFPQPILGRDAGKVLENSHVEIEAVSVDRATDSESC